LVVHPAEYPLSWQGGHFRWQQGYVLPIPGAELEGSKKNLPHSTDKQISIAQRLTNGLPVFSKFHRSS
jgi:hypothetical protein